MNLTEQKAAGLAPEWMTEEGYKAQKKRQLSGETVKGCFERVAKAAASYTNAPEEKAKQFFEIAWNNIFCFATPVASNMGTNRGLPISCFKTKMHDTLMGHSGIKYADSTAAVMSKMGGGVGIAIDSIRPKGAPISSGGSSNGILPWMRMLDTTFDTVSQGGRRGSGVVSLNIEHPDWLEFIEARENTGDPRRRVYELHLSTRISNAFMQKLFAGDTDARMRWEKLLLYRAETGESYIEFIDNINDSRPQAYIDRKMFIENTNICTEILQYVDEDHDVVCCLGSMNAATYPEWKHRAFEVIGIATEFLDAVLSEFIVKATDTYLQKAVRGATKARAIGLGYLGFHDLLIRKGLAFDNGMETMRLNAELFRTLDQASLEASKRLAIEYGEPEWLKGYGVRNMFRIAQAPTKTTSAVAGVQGEGISPIVGASWQKEGAEGDIYIKNPYFETLLETYGKNDHQTWKTIYRAKGSVQHLDFLTEEEKKIFLTAREIDQHKLIRMAAQRQQFIDQGQSLNLFFPANASASYLNSVHLLAWELKLKTLYYMKTGAAISAKILTTCESCEA